MLTRCRTAPNWPSRKDRYLVCSAPHLDCSLPGGALGVSLHLWALALICTHKRNVLTALQVGCSHYRAALSALPHILTEFLFPTSLPQPQATDSPQALFTQDPGAS